MLLTLVYPVLEALADGRVIRRAVVIALNALAVATAVGGIVSLAFILRVAFDDGVPADATIGGLLWAALFAAVVLVACQIYRFHIRDIDALADARFVSIPIAAVLFRVVGEQLALWWTGIGVGALVLVVFSAPHAGRLLGVVSVMPGVPSAASGVLGGLWVLLVSVVTGAGGLLFFYLLSELTLVAGDLGNQVRRLVAIQERAPGDPISPVDRVPLRTVPAEGVSGSRSSLALEPSELAEVVPLPTCSSCGTALMPGGRFCENCGARAGTASAAYPAERTQ